MIRPPYNLVLAGGIWAGVILFLGVFRRSDDAGWFAAWLAQLIVSAPLITVLTLGGRSFLLFAQRVRWWPSGEVSEVVAFAVPTLLVLVVWLVGGDFDPALGSGLAVWAMVVGAYWRQPVVPEALEEA